MEFSCVWTDFDFISVIKNVIYRQSNSDSSLFELIAEILLQAQTKNNKINELPLSNTLSTGTFCISFFGFLLK